MHKLPAYTVWREIVILFACLDASSLQADTDAGVRASRLAPIPVNLGLAGTYAGVCHDELIVAGGANFPDRPPWEGGRKVWHDEVYVLSRPDGAWQFAGKQRRPLGYGVSLTVPQGVIFIGGSDATKNYADVFLLNVENGRLSIHSLPSLPKSVANACGAVIGQTIYLAGGNESPESTRALGDFFSLDLRQPGAKWQSLPSWRGPERMMACATAHDGAFYLFSGVRLSAGPDGKPVRSYLRDAYRYAPDQGWKRLADLPRAAAAAPSPAPIWNGTIVVVGGDDGSKLGFQPPEKHPGFSVDMIGYNTQQGRWSNLGKSPVSRANLPTAAWRGAWILPSGEVRPGVRSPEVWSLVFPSTE